MSKTELFRLYGGILWPCMHCMILRCSSSPFVYLAYFLKGPCWGFPKMLKFRLRNMPICQICPLFTPLTRDSIRKTRFTAKNYYLSLDFTRSCHSQHSHSFLTPPLYWKLVKKCRFPMQCATIINEQRKYFIILWPQNLEKGRSSI